MRDIVVDENVLAEIVHRLVETAVEVEDWSAVRNYVTTRAITEGQVLYEKRS